MLPFPEGWTYWLCYPEVCPRCHHAQKRLPGADAARPSRSGRSCICRMESHGSAPLWMTCWFLHWPGGNLATPQGHCVHSNPKPDGNFLFKTTPSVFPLLNQPGKNFTVVSAVLTLTSARGFQSSSSSDSETRAIEMWLSCPDFFLLSRDIFIFFFHLHLANKNLPHTSLWICQDWPIFQTFLFFPDFIYVLLLRLMILRFVLKSPLGLESGYYLWIIQE